ncbi:GH92 family glycosyl hydrolase [Ignavibacteria bacterium 4148-Me]|uniref:GH92 family glycosyl hydrolase n=1 Tax=Rosettibacter primus TaxID=3111523 RepID=UPI00336C0A24
MSRRIFLLIFLILYKNVFSLYNITENKIIKYVNPFIGTSNSGNTFPGAVVPWGMVSVSPHNAPGTPSGYIYGEKYFYGFGHVHISGAGCSDLGSIIVTVSNRNIDIPTFENYKTIYSEEYSKPGYYKLKLDEQNVTAEVTATERCGITKFTATKNTTLRIIFDIGRSLNLVGGGKIKIVSKNEIQGFNISGGFCGEPNRQSVYFYAFLNKNADSIIIWDNNKYIKRDSAYVEGGNLVSILYYKLLKGDSIIVKVGISYVSTNNAKLNLIECRDYSFSELKRQAEEKWEEMLSRILIYDINDTNKIKFYTAFYHMLIHPNIINDVNGEYPLMGRSGVGKYFNRNRYSIFSLWDTYRTLHPFLTLIFPERQSEIIKTMIDMYKESGFLPKWELAGNETYMMVGDPAPIVIADSYIKGISDIDINTAFEAMLKPTLLKEGQKAYPIRPGYHDYLRYGYIPFEQDWNEEWWVWGPVSTSLEYCLADWSIAQVAKKLNEKELYNEFIRRSEFYINLFDAQSKFMRPRKRDGSWLAPFDSLTKEGSGDWPGSGGPGYVEGNAWNYTWFVPHNVNGLIKLFGGEKACVSKLLRCFNENHFDITNEPDISYPYLFTFFKGYEYYTYYFINRIISENYGVNEKGLPGNDDCGTISGWLLFSLMGFYPFLPASQDYVLGMPFFDKIIIRLNENYYSKKEFIIQSIGNRKSFLMKKIELNGKLIRDYKISHNDLIKGGILKFYFEN